MKKPIFLDKNLFTVDSSTGKIAFFSLLWPMLFESVSSNFLATVNTAVISGYSEAAAAAVGACGPIVSALMLITNVLSVGATVVISNYIGAKNLKKAKEACFTGLTVCALLLLLLTPVMIIAAPAIMEAQNLRGEILANAITYLSVRILFITVSAANSFLLAVLRCYGYTKYTFYSGILQNAVNLFLNLLFVNLSELTSLQVVAGAAFSCCAGSLAALAMAVIAFKKKHIGMSRPKTLNDAVRHTCAILKIGLPSAISSASFTVSQIVTTSFVALIGDYALSAKVYYTSILQYAYLFSYSAGFANALMVGVRYGAGEIRECDKMNKQLVRLTALVNLSISLLIVAAHRPLVGIFSDNAQIISLAVGIFLVDVITEQGRAVSHVYEYALRSVGDVWCSLVALTLSCWTFGIGLSYLLVVELNMGLLGCWIGLAADEAFRGVFTYIRWNRKHTKLTNIDIKTIANEV